MKNNFEHLRYVRSVQGVQKPPQKEIETKQLEAQQKYSTNQCRMQFPRVDNW